MRRITPALSCVLLFLSACSQPAQQEITEVREPGTTKREAPPKMDVRQRLGMRQSGGDMGASAADDPLGGITFHTDMPPGWESVPKTSFRQVNLRMTEVPEAECYFTFLPGGGGGVAANLNRWRGQMGLDPLTEDAIAALPTLPMFGQPATFIQIDGAYSGMGSEAKPDYRMYGLILTFTDPTSQEEQAFFLKMTGPRSVLEGQKDAFELVASSLHAVAPGDEHTHDHDDHGGHDHGADDGHDHGDHAGHDHGDHAGHDHGAVSGTLSGDKGFRWMIPAGWEARDGSMMRVANLSIAGQEEVECYFTVLAGNGGGLEMNINRWQEQMGQPDLSSEAIAALPKHPLLGAPATFVTIDGTFVGMQGSFQKEDFRMYGMVRVDESQAYFVKMTGPRAVLEAQQDAFLAFAESIERDTPADTPKATEVSGAPEAPEATPTAENPHGNPHGMKDPTPEGGFNPDGLTWTAPEGWEDGGDRMMRVVTYEIGEVECYITSLSGPAGGVAANINRWVGQMGQPELDEAALAALPEIAILNTTAPMVEVSGNFTGMSGVEKKAYTLLGTVVPQGDKTIFVKMTGPSDAVAAEKDKFIAFCASIKP
jgi:hypothetical protein